MATVWLIRNDVLNAELEQKGFVSIGWDGTPDLRQMNLDDSTLTTELTKHYPDASAPTIAAWAGTLRRFADEIEIGDIVVAPFEADGVRYLRVGIVSGPYRYDSNAPTHRHRRDVTWKVPRLERARLSPAVTGGLRNISTLSRVLKNPEAFERLAADPDYATELYTEADDAHSPVSERAVWLVGASTEGQTTDRTEEFVRDGYWKSSDGLSGRALEMQPGDRIAIKAAYVQRHDLPFENNGLPVSCMDVKARGTITAKEDDRVRVEWDPTFTQRTWYFYTYRGTVWKVDLTRALAPHLVDFVFNDRPQDYELFLSDPFWSRYRADQPSEKSEPHATFRVSSPSVQAMYAAADAWRQSLIEGTSLFTGEPTDLKAAADDLITYFVERPDMGSGTFLTKLQTQLEPASEAAVQLAAELLFIYYLPVASRSTLPDTKRTQISTITSWRDGLGELPQHLSDALSPGVAKVGTGYNTYRWKIFQYLCRLVATISRLSYNERAERLLNWDAFTELLNSEDEQSAWSMRFLLEHLLFPDNAVPAASREHRQEMLASFGDHIGRADDDVNTLLLQLPPNTRYGDRLQISPYTAPHYFTWHEPNVEIHAFGAWIAFVNEQEDGRPAEGASEALKHGTTLESLDKLGTSASRKLGEWLASNDAFKQQVDADLRIDGAAKLTDDLAEQLGYTGEPAEWVEAVTTLFNAIDQEEPRFYRASIERLSAPSLSLMKRPERISPGELLQHLLASTESVRWILFDLTGIDLSPSHAATLAQQVLELDPVETDWSDELQAAFRDWRGGQRIVMPDDVPELDIPEPEPPVKDDDKPTPTNPKYKRKIAIPETLEDLATQLNFTTEPSLDWLRETRDLLRDKRQMILQGPPGTGKTFVARRLANFLARDEENVTLLQFHPATSYEDFVQGFRPDPETPNRFNLRNGPLLHAAEKAAADPLNQHVVVIDEINRANLPAVFGELYFLLEYRDESVVLNYGDRFRLPKNLLLIGTMNTADRSIAAIDAALRRRFVIRDLRPGEAPMNEVLTQWLTNSNKDLLWLTNLLEQANALIDDPDQHIGPSHFLLSGEKLTEQWAQRAWENTVIPTLKEYFYGNTEIVEKLSFASLKKQVRGAVDELDLDAD